MDSFNVRQAAILMGEETLPNKTEQFIKNHDFIRYIPEKKIYVIHSILKDYLQTRLYHYKSEDYKNKIFRNAGDAYASISKYFQAAEFFFKIKDFDAIFSLPFSREYLSNQKEKCNTEFIEIIINECPEEILCKYPNTMIVFGYQMLMCGNIKSYQKLCGLIGLSILIEDRLDQMDIQRIKGEYMLLISLGDFNDVFKMEEGQRKAQQDNMEDFISEILVNNSANYKSDYSSYLTAISSGTERLTRLAELRKLCQRQSKGVRIIRKAIQQDKSPLTPREREVANLARDRLTAKEIADKLYISEATVRTILKNVYRKLDIHSKKELNSKEF